MIKILGMIATHFCPLGRNTNVYKVIPNANTVNKQNKQERSLSRTFLKLGIPLPPPNRLIVSSYPLLLKDIATSKGSETTIAYCSYSYIAIS